MDDLTALAFPALRHVADKIAVASRRVVNKELFQDCDFVACELPHIVDAIAIGIDTYVIGMPLERIVVNKRWPADWWQAFRERWCPKWWLSSWPVRYEEIHIDEQRYGRVCPHVRVQNQGVHLEWMSAGYGEHPVELKENK